MHWAAEQTRHRNAWLAWEKVPALLTGPIDPNRVGLAIRVPKGRKIGTAIVLRSLVSEWNCKNLGACIHSKKRFSLVEAECEQVF